MSNPPELRFSVIIPTLGRDISLRAAIVGLTAQTYDRDRFEILIAFDGVAPTPQVADLCASIDAYIIRLEHRLGPGAARNAAANRARGEILAFTEDDCIVDHEWLSHAARRFDDEPTLEVLEGLTEKPDGRAVRRRPSPHPVYLPTNLFVRRARFVEVGGYSHDYFDTTSRVYFREDSDLGFSLEAVGARVAVDHEVRVTHPAEHPGFLDPLRWARRYLMDPLLARRHPARFDDRIEVLELGPIRLRRPFVRACILELLGLSVGFAGFVSGIGPIAVTGTALAILSLLALWAKWGFDPRRLLIIPFVPIVLVYSLIEGERRARRIEGRRVVKA